MATPDSRETNMTTGRAGSLQEMVREWLITGAALTIPFLITVMVLAFVVDFVATALTPVVGVARFLGLVGPISGIASGFGLGIAVGSIVIQLGTLLFLLGTVFVVGFIADRTSSKWKFSQTFHTAMEAIPGVGSVYTSFRRMSDVLVESDTDSFQEVKLVQFPNEWTYSFAFVTADSPPELNEAAEADDLWTLFMPLAPNPVMGGFLVHIPDDRVSDIDITVEEAISAIVTSGVTMGDAGNRNNTTSLSAAELNDLGQYDTIGQVRPKETSAGSAGESNPPTERAAEDEEKRER